MAKRIRQRLKLLRALREWCKRGLRLREIVSAPLEVAGESRPASIVHRERLPLLDWNAGAS